MKIEIQITEAGVTKRATGEGSLPAPSSVFLVDCSAYGPAETETIMEALADNRILKIEKQADGRFELREMCGEFFCATLTKDQLHAWADELHKIADS